VRQLDGFTRKWSSEFALRPFIGVHPELTDDHVRRWVTADDERLRRLVSEGAPPRLPWAPHLRGLIADPSPNRPLLDPLSDDRSPGRALPRRHRAREVDDARRLARLVSATRSTRIAAVGTFASFGEDDCGAG
jgi:3-methyladenine DNA glycosylase AlkC